MQGPQGTRLDPRLEVPQWLLIAAMWLLAALEWPSAPERIPIHWNAEGQVNGYGGKVEGLLLLPAMTLGIYLLLLFLPRIDPGRANYAQFWGAYGVIRLAVVALMAGIYAVTLLWVRGTHLDISSIVPIAVGVLFVVLGSLMGKLRPNWFAGIRTPWTLSSTRSWINTHRLGGWVFLTLGLLLIVTGFLHGAWFFAVFMGALAASVVLLVAYSYVEWRHDPNKMPPGGTLPG